MDVETHEIVLGYHGNKTRTLWKYLDGLVENVENQK